MVTPAFASAWQVLLDNTPGSAGCEPGALVRLENRRMFPYYNPGIPPVQPSALEILNQRYARGEIDAATYEQMRERLEASSGPGRQ